MVRDLLIRGMLVGFLAGLLVFTFAKVFGEPQVDVAIAFESAMDEARDKALKAKGVHVIPEPELVSREMQASFGLLTGVMTYCTAFGGLFALIYVFTNGRLNTKLGPRAFCGLIALTGFIAAYLVPDIKYPANPPSVGHPDTISHRTVLYFIMMAFSIGGMVGAAILRKRLVPRHGGWNATLIATAAYVLAMALVQEILPRINEVPATFPAVTLWQFRLDSFGMQLIMWTTIGLAFGALVERKSGFDWEQRSRRGQLNWR